MYKIEEEAMYWLKREAPDRHAEIIQAILFSGLLQVHMQRDPVSSIEVVLEKVEEDFEKVEYFFYRLDDD